MAIDKKTVAHIARLSRLAVGEDELAGYAEQLSEILAAAEQLAKLDTEGVEPTAHAIPVHNVFREDVVRDSMPKEKVLANGPDVAEGMFKVPRILEEE